MKVSSLIACIVCFLSLLLGCSPSSSEQANWQIKHGSLWLGSETVDWQSATAFEMCNTCNIKQIADFHPSGPSVTYQLFITDKWKASKVDEYRNWILIWQNNHPVKIFVKAFSDTKLLLSLPNGEIEMDIQSKTNFSYNGKHYQLWVESYRSPVIAAHFANELDSHHIDYLLLSLE